MNTIIEPPVEQIEGNVGEVENVTIRFAGDSGGGMESLPGLSGFQVNFSSHEIKKPGDKRNVLVAMNPAALKVNLADLEDGGTIVVNTDAFTPENLKYAHYTSNPLEDGSLAGFRVHKLPITTLNINALKGNVELSRREIDRCKNFVALGVLYWLYDRPMDNTLSWIRSFFRKNPELAKANEVALKTGYDFAEKAEIAPRSVQVKSNQHVLLHGEKWALKSENSSHLSVFRTKQEAIDAGRSIVKRRCVELVVHGPSGQIFYGPKSLSFEDEEKVRQVVRTVSSGRSVTRRRVKKASKTPTTSGRSDRKN